jgi:hypothetical protein
VCVCVREREAEMERERQKWRERMKEIKNNRNRLREKERDNTFAHKTAIIHTYVNRFFNLCKKLIISNICCSSSFFSELQKTELNRLEIRK